MTTDLPVLWLCGPPGVGKTAVAWEVYRRLSAAGVKAAYVDVDQLGICYPEPPGDPGRHRLKARNVAAVRANFKGAGATCLIVSGVVDAAAGLAAEIVCPPTAVGRLRVDPPVLLSRLRGRRGSFAVAEGAAHEADLLDRTAFADWVLDTTTSSIAEVADQVMARSRLVLEGEGDREDRAGPPVSVPSSADGEVLWLAGPLGVGKSTVGFLAYLKALGAGAHAGFVDVAQLGFFDEPATAELRARNLVSVWATYHAAGMRRLVVVGSVGSRADAEVYERAMPHTRFTWCRLHAGPDEITRRVLSRGEGGSWPEPGDRLKGLPADELLSMAVRACADAARLDVDGVGDGIVVDGLSADEAAAAVLARANWPATR